MIQADAQPNAGLILTVFPAVVASIIPALLAAFGFWWRQRRDSRDRAQEHHRVLVEVKDEIDALGAWLNAYRLVVPQEAEPAVAARAKQHLESAYERLEKSLQDNQAALLQHISFAGYLNAFLIRRNLQDRPAIRARRLYYVSLGWAALGNVLFVALIFSPHEGLGLAGWIFFLVFFWAILFSWPPVVFYILTNSRDRRSRQEVESYG